ncbi:hypothetical protein [uncultured Alistipes sp.]|uniref:hypothetical protein n=1 Tax=uncultured Alistipes sp. TaxID=538949 RepID=UPI0025D954D9|nr:hypothetical protein [uncultured Alistipes sp.]
MKKQFFKKFLALFLTGTMLAGVGCKSYDDDIDSINKKLDELETVTIKDLQSQIDGVKSSVEVIEDLSSRLSTLEGTVEGMGDVAQKLRDLENTLKSYVDNAVKDSEQTLRNEFATKSALNELISRLEQLEGVDVQGLIDAAIEEFKKDSWLGEQMNEYIANYKFDYDYVNAEGAADAVLEQIKGQNEEYKEAILALIGSADGLTVSKEMLSDELKAYLEKIEELEQRVADLENRIQSLVYVPAYADGKVVFPASYAIQMTNEEGETSYFSLGAAEKQQAELKFRVTPASLAVESKLNAETLSIVTEEVMTRAEGAAFTIDEVKEWNAAKGEFVVVVSTDYDYFEARLEEQPKTLAIALHVAIDNAASTEENPLQGIEYTSEFIPTEGGQTFAVNNLLTVARLEGDKYVELKNNEYASDVEFTDKNVRNFFEGYSVVLKQDGELMALNSVWENVPQFELVAPEDAATVTNGHEENYELTETSAAIVTPAPELVGDVITSGAFTFRLKDQNGNYADVNTQAVAKLNIISVDTEVETAQLDAPVVWNYAAASGSQEYTAQYEFTNKLDVERFNALKSLMPTFTVTDAKGATVSDIQVAAESYSQPSAEGDVQRMTLKLTDAQNHFIAGGNYTVVALYEESAAGTTVTVKFPLTVEGLPAVADQLITKEIAYEPNTRQYKVFLDFAQIIWNTWGEAAEKYFADYATFKSALNGKQFVSTSEEENTLRAEDGSQILIGSDNIAVSFAKTETPYELSGKLTTTWGLEVVFGGTFTLNKPQGVLLQRGSDLPADNRVLIATTLEGGVFSVDNKDLVNTYFYDGDVAGVSVKFAIDRSDEEADYGTAGVSGTKLSWGSYKGLELPIVVTLEDNNGVVFDLQKFTAYIADPIKDQAITAKDGSIGATTTDQTLYISTLLTLKDMNNANVFAAPKTDDGTTDAKGLLTNIKTPLGAEVSYSTPDIIYTNRISFDPATGLLTVKGSTDTSMAVTETVSIDVTFTYAYGEKRTGTVKVAVAQK